MQVQTPRPPEAVVPIRSPDLATLAAIAAITLDRRVHGYSVPLDPVRDLATELRRTLTDSKSRGGVANVRSSLLDPMTFDLFGRALTSSFAANLRSESEVEQQANDVVDQLSGSRGDLVDDLTRLRDFCLALSQAAQMQSAASRVTQPHPYRR